VSSSFVEKNNLYHHRIPINIPTTTISGVNIFVINLNMKFLILSHPHSVELGSAASKCSFMGSIDLSIEASNLHNLSTLNENILLFCVKSVSSHSKFVVYHQFLFTKHSISTVLCVCVSVLLSDKFHAIIVVSGWTLNISMGDDLNISFVEFDSIQLINHSHIVVPVMF
jgi:hypothetical protein